MKLLPKLIILTAFSGVLAEAIYAFENQATTSTNIDVSRESVAPKSSFMADSNKQN